MNMHLPQSLVTSVELQELAAVANQIISVRECKPIISIVQDVALGVYRFTKSGVRLNEKQVMNLLASNPKGTCIVPAPLFSDKNVKRWNGRQVMSTIIPKNTNLRAPNKSFDEEKPDDSENYVVIENGEHKQGIMDKLTYQNRTRGLIHSIFNECGPEETRLFLDNTQRVICDWLVQSGYSVGVSDIMTDAQTDADIKKMIHDMKVEVYDKIRDIHTGNFENNSINANSAYFEEEVNRILNTTSNKVGKIAKSKINDLDNRMINMVNAGSKGSIINVSQMMACLGQVNVDGKRIGYGFDDRTLPHYTKFDDGPESRGFVENSFIKGLTPQEFFFHAMGGREGLIDTAVKSVTAETPIVIIEEGVPKYVTIGSWIDAHLDAQAPRVRHFEERQMELLDLEHPVYIPTMAYDGMVTWGTVTALTRHDPGDALYRITTESGRSVIVTESKSLLVWKDELDEFREVLTPEIKVGDAVPTTAYQPAPPVALEFVDLAPKDEIVFGDYVPDRFEFTRENGIALGRYLASDGTRRNMVPEIEKFVQAHVPGAAKHVPEVAYVANQAFVEGLLVGYFTCGTTQFLPHAVQTKEVSQRMCDGLTMLLSRFGVFASYSPAEKQLTIRGMWKKAFVDQLWPRMSELPTPHSTNTAAERWKNHVVIDKIVSIDVLGTEAYPKVYDLTIPETLNFGLANGLQVRDTSETGYIQRKLVKAMEDCKISYDYTVRNASGAIVQFLYGEDGMEASKIESHPLLYIEKDFDKLKREYLLAPYDDLKYYLDDATLKEFLATPDWESTMEEHFRQVLYDREYIITKIFGGKKETSILYPISLMRLVNNARALFKDRGLSDLNPMYVLKTIESLGEELYVSKTNRGNMVLKMLLRCYLSPKKVATEYKFNRSTFDYMVQQIRHKFYDAIAHPSEMVGVIAAQSIGEPSTQMTLNTFHLSGVSSASKAVRGVPRLKELLSVTRNIKAPALTVHLKEPYRSEKIQAKKVLNTVQTTYFSDIVRSTKIYYDPDDFKTTIDDDASFVDSYREFINQGMVALDNLSPWLLRLEFDKDKMVEYDINMMEIYNALQEFYEDSLSVMFSDDNAGKLVFRIKLNSDEGSDDIITDLKALEKNILENLIVKGVRKVSKVIMSKNEFFQYNPDTLGFDKTTEWVLETSGTNLMEIFAHRNVDPANTVSNDINEIYETLGIEAARQALYNEISDVIKFADLYVNYRHLALLVDTMTNKGYLLSIDRHGINRVDIGPLAKSSFEETNDMIVKAGVFSEVDKIAGVSACCMVGAIAPGGCGTTDILVDEAKLPSIQVPPKEPEIELDPEEACKKVSMDYKAPSVPAPLKAAPKKKKQSVKLPTSST